MLTSSAFCLLPQVLTAAAGFLLGPSVGDVSLLGSVMPSTCKVEGCRNSSREGYGLVRYPVDPSIREKWLVAISNASPDAQPRPDSDRICEIHFNPDEIVFIGKNRKEIRRGAVPSHFCKCSDVEEPEPEPETFQHVEHPYSRVNQFATKSCATKDSKRIDANRRKRLRRKAHSEDCIANKLPLSCLDAMLGNRVPVLDCKASSETKSELLNSTLPTTLVSDRIAIVAASKFPSKREGM